MKKISISANRRAFLIKAVAGAPAAVAAGSGALSAGALFAGDAQAQDSGPYKPTYFSQQEFDTLAALVDTLIPADETGPGGVEAGVVEFIDKQMDTPYAHGGLWYMDGPHQPDAPAVFGYQLPESPRELYRKGLHNFETAVQAQYGKSFTQMDAAQRELVVGALEKGTLKLADLPGDAFFGQLLQNVHEGYFCDPVHGGNKGMAAWKMIGFPGARADYYDWVDQYGKRYPLPPVSRG
ncbi:gluconate 2-dehydrogenase subunit 3 family protein [Robbsia sp. KACC 23696]|uniref:gluconate 2-dehydrogenase subunit 3 family protein n=1 Tax=Robbsia sp. KACC 23696 TaxID=3149231 RepID=UPI00325B3B56